jgi:hypothetical protein
MLNNKENESLVHHESNQQATDRIRNELEEENKLNQRRDIVMSYFFELTNMPMPQAWFEEYNMIFNKAQAGYNIMSFIKSKQSAIDNYHSLMKHHNLASLDVL